MEDYSSFIGNEQLVKNAAEIIANIEMFNKDICESEYLISNLSRFKDWYYDLLTNQFGPKKFVGFKKMTAEKYVALKTDSRTNRRGNFDTSLTAPILRELSVQADEDMERELFVELEIFLADYDAHPRRNAEIHIV